MSAGGTVGKQVLLLALAVFCVTGELVFPSGVITASQIPTRPEPVRVFDQRLDEMSYVIRAEYRPRVAGPVTLSVRFDLQNMNTDKPVPYTVVLDDAGLFDLVKVTRRDPQLPWNFRYDSHWQYGDREAHHHDTVSYRLPYSSGVRCRVTQGYQGTFSHRGPGAFAIDFAMPEGTLVRAARQGWVIFTRDDVTTTVRGKPVDVDREGGVPSNQVVILHEDDTIGWYMHLKPGGVQAEEGRFVRGGDVIGLSGDTGLSSEPHLHFEVYKPRDGYVRQTIPVVFEVEGEILAVRLQEGIVYQPR